MDLPSDYVLFDPFIQAPTTTISQDITPITPNTAIHIKIKVLFPTELTEDEQLAQYGMIWNSLPSMRKTKFIRHTIEGHVVSKGCILTTESNLSIEVVSTEPSLPVQVAYGTNITIMDHTMDDISTIGNKMDSLSIHTEHEGRSSLQKAFQSLYEIVCFPFLYKDWIDQLHIECPKGILLYGPPGVGKTFLVSSVAQKCGAKLFVVQGSDLFGPYIGESEEKLRKIFTEARNHGHPAILFIDEIDALTPRRDNSQSHENRMVAQLLTLMDGVESRGKLVIVGATNRPNSIDPALRRPGRFDREISLDAPDVQDRLSLLKTQLRTMPLDESVNIDTLSSVTNGYVAADINSLCREAAMIAVQRASKQLDKDISVTTSDFKSALSIVGPSMQRGFQVHVEKLNWDDVGGLADVKKKLKQAVEWPLLYKDSFIKLGLKPPRGILLYGPPGCSKTTLVKIIASSANIAFLSINGAQLYSPFVGDSEKVVRTTFQKARASAPSIIFLDETEAIVGRRNMGQGGSSGDSVQERILSTLLNEMDGVESAESVLVVGATNRPDMLDAALMRPGRFDKVVYVPPPDKEARLEILRIHTKHMPLDSDVDLTSIADRTNYYTGADLQNLCREAAMDALRRDQKIRLVGMANFNASLNTIPPSLNEESLKLYSENPYQS
ncbi:P-loop containing nucleoside triphosphate hydrolase protein [Pilobolus umbonatus]|nr:P-loop containing nucleoside triphosphate hydrolase protein [Pilobolus umbonatus]